MESGWGPQSWTLPSRRDQVHIFQLVVYHCDNVLILSRSSRKDVTPDNEPPLTSHHQLEAEDVGSKGLICFDLPMGGVAEQYFYTPLMLTVHLQHEHVVLRRGARVNAACDFRIKQESKVYVHLLHCAHIWIDPPGLSTTNFVSIKVDIHHIFFLTPSFLYPYPCRCRYSHRPTHSLSIVGWETPANPCAHPYRYMLAYPDEPLQTSRCLRCHPIKSVNLHVRH